MAKQDRYEEFVHLVRLHTSQVLAYINAILLNWNDSEDLFQETCLVLWQKFDEFEPGSNFLAWSLRIADFKVMNFRSAQSRRVAFTAGLRDALQDDFCSQRRDDSTSGLTALSTCMEKLPECDRRLASLCYGDGISVRQVADSMGRSPESVHRSLRRIRQKLLDCIHRDLKKAELPSLFPHGFWSREDRS